FLTLPSDNMSNQLWECFKNTYNANKKGQDGCTRILSIIAKEFTYTKLEKKLGISSKTISSTRLYATTNSPGCPALCKPTITRIVHSIKCYVRLGYNIQNENDIVDTIRDIKGTSVANINP
ncbi:3042_t:CDS:2, partial [Dentiscutata heterogama]